MSFLHQSLIQNPLIDVSLSFVKSVILPLAYNCITQKAKLISATKKQSLLHVDSFKSLLECINACVAGLCVLRPDGRCEKVRDAFRVKGSQLELFSTRFFLHFRSNMFRISGDGRLLEVRTCMPTHVRQRAARLLVSVHLQ